VPSRPEVTRIAIWPIREDPILQWVALNGKKAEPFLILDFSFNHLPDVFLFRPV
jgi:hypothetical protein